MVRPTDQEEPAAENITCFSSQALRGHTGAPGSVTRHRNEQKHGKCFLCACHGKDKAGQGEPAQDWVNLNQFSEFKGRL